MDKPKCRLCGGRHWSDEPHVFEAKEEAPAKPRSRPSAKASEKPVEKVPEVVGSVACACGCGVLIPIKPRYATAACRQRVSRARRTGK